MFGGRSQYNQGLTQIQLKADYASTSNIALQSPLVDIKSTYGSANAAEVRISGSISISGSNTLTNWGNWKGRFHQDRHYLQITTDPSVAGGWRQHMATTKHTGSAPHLHFALSGSGQASFGTLSPQHTLHVSESSANFDALHVEGTTQFTGFAGANGFGNPNTLTGNTVIPAGYNVVLWVTTNSPSLTVPVGVNYTIGVGSNVKTVNMDTAF